MGKDYTEGPWHTLPANQYDGKIGISANKSLDPDAIIAYATKQPFYANTQKANASLIAASPDLFEACEAAMDFYMQFRSILPQDVGATVAFVKISQAILKAKGEL